MRPAISPKRQMTLLRAWHAWFAGAFIVAILSAEEGPAALHRFAGYAALLAIAARLGLAALAAGPGPLRLPRPSLAAIRRPFGRTTGRHPLFAWLAAALVVTVGAAALVGAGTDRFAGLEESHEAAAGIALYVVLGHLAFVGYKALPLRGGLFRRSHPPDRPAAP